MPTPLLHRVARRFRGGILRTTGERWIDGLGAVVTIAWLFFSKPVSAREFLAPFVWLLSLICAAHIGRAVHQVWSEIINQATVREVESPILRPDATKIKTLVIEEAPPHFRARLIAMLGAALVALGLLSYLVRRKGFEAHSPTFTSFQAPNLWNVTNARFLSG